MSKRIKREIVPGKRLLLWKVLNTFLPLVPLLVLALVQWDIYFGKHAKNAFNNVIGFAGIFLFMIIILISMNNQSKNEGRRSKYLSVGMFALSAIFWFLREILYQMTFISLVAALGLLIRDIWTNPKVKRWEHIRQTTEDAGINANAMAKAMSREMLKVMSNKENLDGSV